MPRRSAVPSLRRHNFSGQGVVTLSGHDHYLGAWPDGRRKAPPPVQAAYDALISEWVAGGRRPLAEAGQPPALTVGELIVRYWSWAEPHYEGDARRGELANVRGALRPVRELFERLPVGKFGPIALKQARGRMAAAGLARSEVNRRVGKVVRMFKWAVAEELAEESVWRALTAVPGLQKGRSPGVRETEPVPPVADADVEATLPALPAEVRAMAQLQRLTGMRPGEVCRLRAVELDRAGPVWLYRPGKHKNSHRGKSRCVAVGPRAQGVLLPFLRARCPLCGLEDRAGRLRWRGALCGACADSLDRAGVQGPWPAAPVCGDYFVFSPAEEQRDRYAALRAGRKTPVQPSQVCRKKRRPGRPPGACYTPNSYAGAVRRACRRAGVGPWSPNQLRHSHATEVRRLFGLEAAMAAMGHARPDTTLIYAERDLALAVRVAGQVG